MDYDIAKGIIEVARDTWWNISGDNKICLDGYYTDDELEAYAWMLRNRPEYFE